MATATALTARSIADAVRRFVLTKRSRRLQESFLPRDDSLRRRSEESQPWCTMLSRRISRHSASSCDSPTSSACLRKRKKPLASLCWLMRHGTGDLRTCLPPRAQNEPACWERFPMRRGHRTRTWTSARETESRCNAIVLRAFRLLCRLVFRSCFPAPTSPDPNTLVMIIEIEPHQSRSAGRDWMRNRNASTI